MAATFVPVTLADFQSLLTSKAGWVQRSGEQGREIEFHYRPKRKPRLLVKVYTSVTADGTCRTKGADAIRVVVIRTSASDVDDGVAVYKGITVKRTKNWRDAVTQRVTDGLTSSWDKAPWDPKFAPKSL